MRRSAIDQQLVVRALLSDGRGPQRVALPPMLASQWDGTGPLSEWMRSAIRCACVRMQHVFSVCLFRCACDMCPNFVIPATGARSACSEAVGRLVCVQIGLPVSREHAGQIRMLTA